MSLKEALAEYLIHMYPGKQIPELEEAADFLIAQEEINETVV